MFGWYKTFKMLEILQRSHVIKVDCELVYNACDFGKEWSLSRVYASQHSSPMCLWVQAHGCLGMRPIRVDLLGDYVTNSTT